MSFENFNLFWLHFATFSENYQNIIKTSEENLIHENFEAIKNTLNKCLLKHKIFKYRHLRKDIAI